MHRGMGVRFQLGLWQGGSLIEASHATEGLVQVCICALHIEAALRAWLVRAAGRCDRRHKMQARDCSRVKAPRHGHHSACSVPVRAGTIVAGASRQDRATAET
eukprot:355301-Chlamydomonas_euryale.AAC.3